MVVEERGARCQTWDTQIYETWYTDICETWYTEICVSTCYTELSLHPRHDWHNKATSDTHARHDTHNMIHIILQHATHATRKVGMSIEQATLVTIYGIYASSMASMPLLPNVSGSVAECTRVSCGLSGVYHKGRACHKGRALAACYMPVSCGLSCALSTVYHSACIEQGRLFGSMCSESWHVQGVCVWERERHGIYKACVCLCERERHGMYKARLAHATRL